MVRFILFDFDGTLADSKEVALTAMNKMAARHNYTPILPEMLPQLRKLSIIERCNLLGWPVYKLPFLASEFYQLYKQGLHEVQLFPGIKIMLEALHQKGYKIGIVSSNSEQNIRNFLRAQNLTFINQVHGSRHIFGKDKMLKKFLKAQKLQPSEVLYVGDELRDLVACRKCNLKMVWVSWGFDLYELVQPLAPDFVVHTPEELAALLPATAPSRGAQ